MTLKPESPLAPSASVLIKLGSALVHAEELLSPGGHVADKQAFDSLMQDRELREWMDAMDRATFLPVRRDRS